MHHEENEASYAVWLCSKFFLFSLNESFLCVVHFVYKSGLFKQISCFASLASSGGTGSNCKRFRTRAGSLCHVFRLAQKRFTHCSHSQIIF